MTADEIGRLVTLAEGFEARYREYADAAGANEDLDDSRAQRNIGVAFKKCAGQLRDVIADLATPTAEDFDRAAEELALRYALVEQMGHRATVATIRETTFCGKQMLELTAVKTGAVHLVAPESLYEITWLTESDAKARATGVAWTAVALPAANPNPWGDYGADDYPDHADPDEGKDDGMSAAEREEADDLHGFRLDAADEARDLEREAEADL